MRYSLESAGLWDHILPNKKNPQLVAIIFKDKELEDEVKLECQEKRSDKIIALTKINVKCKGYISRICLCHIQQEFQAVKTDWLTHDLWEWLKKRYTLQNTASNWATITSIDELTYVTSKNMAEYRSKYYALKASIKEQSITIEDALKIRMLNNLGPAFKTYLTVVNDQIRKEKKLEAGDILFKAIEEEETRIKADHRASANFASTKSNAKPQGGAAKGKKKFAQWPKCRKYSCKHLADKIFKHANKDCDKCYKRKHISRFHDSYISPNKRKTPEGSATSSSDSKKNVTCVTQVVANKMFETGLTRKIIADSGTTQHLIANCELIRDYYDNYSEYQTGSGEVLQ